MKELIRLPRGLLARDGLDGDLEDHRRFELRFGKVSRLGGVLGHDFGKGLALLPRIFDKVRGAGSDHALIPNSPATRILRLDQALHHVELETDAVVPAQNIPLSSLRRAVKIEELPIIAKAQRDNVGDIAVDEAQAAYLAAMNDIIDRQPVFDLFFGSAHDSGPFLLQKLRDLSGANVVGAADGKHPDVHQTWPLKRMSWLQVYHTFAVFPI